MPHFFKRLCIGATLFLYTGLLPLIAHPTPPDARLSRDIAALPVYDAAPSDRIPYDWLIHPNRSRSGVYRTPDGQGIVVANDMVSRTFRITPALATVAYTNRMLGESLLRAVSNEGDVWVDGRRWSIGGLVGQPERAYLRPDWIEQLSPRSHIAPPGRHPRRPPLPSLQLETHPLGPQ